MTSSVVPLRELAAHTKPIARSRAWGRRLLIGLVMLYVGILIIAPLTRLLIGAFAEGVSPILAALAQPDVLAAFRLTLLIALLTVIFHAVFGMATAWVLVRHRFPGRRLLNGLIDTPFAVSPVVVGYMLLLLFGRNGLLAPLLTAWEIKIAFALPGMILATFFG